MKKIISAILSVCIVVCSVGLCVTALDNKGVTMNAPGRYSLPFDFEGSINPFISIDDVYNNQEHWKYSGVGTVSGDQAMNGNTSLKVGSIRNGNQRTELTYVKMQGNPEFSKTDFSKVSGIWFRIRLKDDNTKTGHSFSLKVMQSGLRPTQLASKATAYDISGNKVEITAGLMSITVPSAFDGFLFFPLESACSEHVTEPGHYDSYQKYPKQMVDLAEDYTMIISLNDSTWGGMSVYFDDISFYSGSTHSEYLETLKKAGYPITAVVQPERYSYPLSFDDQIMPFTAIDDVYDNQIHWKSEGVSLVTGDEALNGTRSVKVDSIREGNQRTELNIVDMAPIENFSKTDFKDISGLLLRIKIANDTSSGDHEFAVALRQTGVNKTTWLANGAHAYDINGNEVQIKNGQLNIRIPSGFDGFLFLPFEAANSENVTDPGHYDNYLTYPDQLVDLAKDYTMQVYFGDSTWSNCSVYLDDLSIYSGASHGQHLSALKQLGYSITAVAQPDRYSYPLSFDDLFMPFNSVSNIYDSAEHVVDSGVSLVTGAEVLNGTHSVKVESIRDGNQRTQLNVVKMAPVANFSKTDFTSATGIMLRMKITGDSGANSHGFTIALRQENVSKPTWLGNEAKVYDINGEIVKVSKNNFEIVLPAGFDGFIFLPFESALSEQITVPGNYDTYQKYPNSMVDLAKGYTMQVYFADSSWNGSDVYLDDMSIYSGTSHNDHLDAIRSFGYSIAAVAQPTEFSFPMQFDDGIMPFNSINSVYDNQSHWINSGIGLINDSSALSGTTSVQVIIPDGNQRTELNNVQMSGINGFSKTDFKTATGLFLRIKINDVNASGTHDLSIALRQNNIAKATWLGNGASAYDLQGNTIQIQQKNLAVRIPANFDGYIFLPFEKAQSETVTQQGLYDSYATYPDSLVNLAESYSMQIYFGDSSWNNSTVLLDDLRIYSGKEHINILKSLYNGIITVQQPEHYKLPIRFDQGMTPFTEPLDGGLYVQKDGKYGTAGKVKYANSDISGRTAMSVNFADNLSGAYSMYTSKAPVICDSGAKGFFFRVKTNAKEAATLNIISDWMSDDSVIFGPGSILYDLKGNAVDHPRENKNWLGCNLPENFDGFIFMPFDKGFIEKKKTNTGNIDGWKFENSVRNIQLFFYGEEQWQGSTLTFDYMGQYFDTNYISAIESLGYELNFESGFKWNDILGEAGNKFFYNLVLNESFDGNSVSELKNWIVPGKIDYQSLSGHYPENCYLENSALVLQYKKETKNAQNYTSGAIRSKQKYSYGYFEASLSLPKLSGTESTFRIVTDGSYNEGGTSFEIDIAYLNKLYELATGYRYMKDYVPVTNGGTVLDGGQKVELSDEFSGSYHTYGMLYTYDYLRFYVDGILVRIVENNFARGSVYIELAENVIDNISDEITNKNSKMYASHVRYWEIDMDEMMTYDALSTQETNFMSGAPKQEQTLAIEKKSNTGWIITISVVGFLDLVGVGFLLIVRYRSKKTTA